MSKLLNNKIWKNRAQLSEMWFKSLRDKICSEFEKLEIQYKNTNKTIKLNPGKFKVSKWKRNEENGGGGLMSIMKGCLFEKVGVNISTVNGKFPDNYKNQIKGAKKDPSYYATGISVVAHMHSPLIPAAHMNTRFILTSNAWFGGGYDLTPTFKNDSMYKKFHKNLKVMCDIHDTSYYKKYSKWCDEYFYLPHRNERRGIGGIFYDYLDTNWEKNFRFTKNVGSHFLESFPNIITENYKTKWNEKQRYKLLEKRGRYAEFNLLYDRGTLFGLKTAGNIDAIFMSLPPKVTWK